MQTEEWIKGRVGMATHDLLREPDWTTVFEIVDVVKKQPQLTHALLKALKPRFKASPRVGINAVRLLKAVVESCPRSRPMVATEEFMSALTAALPKSIREPHKRHLFGGGPVTDVECIAFCDDLLGAIQRWAHVFHNDPQLAAFREANRSLSLSGATFPAMTEDDRRPPIDLAPPESLSVVRTKLPIPRATALTDPRARAAAESATMLVDVINACASADELAKSDIAMPVVRAVRIKIKEIERVLGSPGATDVQFAELPAANEGLRAADEYYDAVIKGTAAVNSRGHLVAPPRQDAATAIAAAASADRPTAPLFQTGLTATIPAMLPVTVVTVPALAPPPSGFAPSGSAPGSAAGSAVSSPQQQPLPQSHSRRTSQGGIVPAALGDVERDASGSVVRNYRGLAEQDLRARQNGQVNDFRIRAPLHDTAPAPAYAAAPQPVQAAASPAKPKQDDGDPFAMLAFAGASGSSAAPPASAPSSFASASASSSSLGAGAVPVPATTVAVTVGVLAAPPASGGVRRPSRASLAPSPALAPAAAPAPGGGGDQSGGGDPGLIDLASLLADTSFGGAPSQQQQFKPRSQPQPQQQQQQQQAGAFDDPFLNFANM